MLLVPAAVASGSSSAPAAGSSAAAKPVAAKAAHNTTVTETSAEALIPEPDSDVPPPGRRLSADQVIAIAAALPKIRAARAGYRGSFAGAYLKSPFRWQVSFFNRTGKNEIGLVVIDDLSGRVLEQWTGFQIAWSMARGYPGAFGEHVNALYIWLPLCLLFILPFFDPRRPFSLLHLDLAVLLLFSVSLAFFNHADIYASVPLSYPPLIYLLVRMLLLLRRPRPGRRAPALRLLVPAPWLAVGVVFLIGFRVGLNVTDGNVIDVGYAGVIGAQRIAASEPLYGGYPSDNEHGDTYGPVNYEAYVPFEQIFGWSGTWDDLPAAHAAAIFFDLLAIGLLFLIGRRMRGPTLGIALAYAWAAYPFTLYTLESDSNDTLVAVVVLAAVLAATYEGPRARAAPALRGAMTALAGLTKIAPLALAPMFATHGLLEAPRRSRPRLLALFLLGFAGAAALALVPALSHDSLHTIYERTIAYQADRGSPFSVWGLYGGLGVAQSAVEVAAVLLAVALAVLPRRAGTVGLAAGAAAVLIALQLGLEHWFYLYIPWFFPLVMLALLGSLSEPGVRPPAVASGSARSSQPEAALSS